MNKFIRFIVDPKFRYSILASRGWYNSVPDEDFIKRKYKLSFGKELNLDFPQTYNEKLQWLKLNYRKPIMTAMVDKYEVKKYIADLIGEEYIIPTLGVWDRFEDIDFDKLPNQFVLKCTHDSGGVIICKDKSELNKTQAQKKLEKCLNRNYYYQNREWPYKDVKPRIIAEQYMEDESGYELKDYKFFCFDGKPKYCQVIAGRDSGVTTIDWYDKDWNHQPFQEPKDYPFSEQGHCKPHCLNEMWELAAKLSHELPFLRVDFYEISNSIKFGELTFFPTSGMGGFTPEEWDYTFGSWIKLPEK
jgi:hypothetical protein